MSAPLRPSKCLVSSDRRPLVVLRDPSSSKGKRTGSEYRALNPTKRRVDVTMVDGCWLSQETACDYVMEVDDTDAFLVELKGSDVGKAIRQIAATLDALSPALRPRRIHARIVSTRTPSPALKTTERIKLEKRLRGELRIQSRLLEETL